MQFEWDEAKAAGNWKKHGVTFAEATRVFDDWSGIEVLDDNIAYGEERWVLIGSTGTVELTVVYTMRGEITRLISARKVTPDERRRYREDNIFHA